MLPTPRLPNFFAWFFLSGVFVSFASVAQTIEHPKCDTPFVAVMVIDDQVNVPPWAADRMRQYRLPMPAIPLRRELDQSGCVTLIDSDPVFATVAPVTQPDTIFRVRIVNMQSTEKSLGEKAGSAVGRYIGAYLGDTAEDLPVLKSVGLTADVLCVRTRRVVHQISAEATGVETAKADNNAEVVNEASANLARAAIQFLKDRPDACGLSR